MKLSIIIPAYNEERSIGKVIERILAQGDNFKDALIDEIEIIVVNDNSRDKTAEVVSGYKDVTLINHEINRGYGAALKTGFSYAKGKMLVFLDGDGTYPPEMIPELCRVLIEKNADLVIGSRFSGSERKMPFIRYVGNKFFAWFLSWSCDKKATDTASGMRIFKKSILPKLYPLPDGLDFTPAMSVRAIYENLKIVEVAVVYAERIGRSKLSIMNDGFRFLRTILYFARMYNPLKFFGFIGVVSILFGFMLGIEPMLHYINSKIVPEYYVYRLLFILMVSVAGTMLISFGMTANFILSVLHGQQLGPKWLNSLIYNKKLYEKLAFIGFLAVISGVMLNLPSIYQYLLTRTITQHWSYFVAGSFLILTGVQLFSLAILLKIVEDLSKRHARIVEDIEK